MRWTPIPRPLLDRMEVLRLAGYSEEEKLEIAKRYLIPKQLKETGLTAEQCTLPDETVRKIISGYTREAGLRRLERAIGRVARKVALRFAEGNAEPMHGDSRTIWRRCSDRSRSIRKKRGAICRPAWRPAWPGPKRAAMCCTSKATLLPDGKGLTLTGQLGEVMQESAKAAQSYIWSHAADFDIDPALFKNCRRARARAGGRDPEGRPVGRRDHGDGADLALHQAAGAQRCGDDRRDHADRPGAADRRRQGEGAGRAAGWNPHGDPAQGQPEGPARSAGGRPR